MEASVDPRCESTPSLRVGPLTWSLAAVAAALLTIAWTYGILRRGFNYDELHAAHTVWMMSTGLRPFTDFSQLHPPYPWYLFLPLAGNTSDALRLLLDLRAVSAVTNLALIVLCIANARVGRNAVPLPSTVAAFLLVLVGRPNIDYLVDFRPDALATLPLLIGTLLLAIRRPGRPALRYALASFLGTASICASPKLFAFWGIFALVDLLRLWRTERRAVATAIGSHVAGAMLAVAAAAAVLLSQGIDPGVAYTLTIEFHALMAKNASFGHGLATALSQQPFLLALLTTGAVCWALLVARRRMNPSAFEIATLLFLPAQAAFVPFPYRQYFVPWFLLGATFVHFLPVALERVNARVSRLAVAAILLVALSMASVSVVGMAAEEGVRSAEAYWKLVRSKVPPGGSVVASVPLHPVTMRDACYGWLRSGDPAGRYETAEAMRDLALPGYSERFTASWYTRELEAARPVLIATGPNGDDRLSSIYGAAVADYVRRHASEYEEVKLPNRTLLIRKPLAAGPAGR